MVDVPQGTPGARNTNLGFIAPNAQPHAGRGVDTSGAFRAVGELRSSYQQLAQTLGRSGEDFEKTGEFLASINNHTAAQEASFNHMIDTDKMINDYTANYEGKAAQDQLPHLLEDVKDRRQKALDSATNPMQKSLIEQDVNSRTAQLFWRASQHAAQQQKSYNDKISDQRVTSFQGQVALSPNDDNIFNKAVDDTAGAAVNNLITKGMITPNKDMMNQMVADGGQPSNAALQAIPPEQQNLAKDYIQRAVGGLWKTRFEKLIDNNQAWKAEDLYHLNKDRQDFAGIHEDAKQDFEKVINHAVQTQGSSQVAAAAINGTPIQYQGNNFKGINFKPEVDNAIRGAMNEVEKEIGHPLHVSFDEARKMAAIESSGEPRSNENKATQYKGLYQMGFKEWGKYGKGEDVYDAQSNARAFLRKTEAESKEFATKTGREPTFFDHYMIHQRGVTGHIEALKNPDKLEWQIMNDAEPGKGEQWAKDTVTKNGGNVNDTAKQFNDRWAAKLGTGGVAKTINPGLPKLDSDNLDKGDNTLDKRLKEAERLSDELSPGNEGLKKNALAATESNYNRVKRQFDSQVNATEDNLYGSMNKNPTDWNTFIADPSNKALYDELNSRDPKKANAFFSKYISVDSARAREDTHPTGEMMSYRAQLYGQAMRDPNSFNKLEFEKDPEFKKLTPAFQLELLNLQRETMKGVPKVFEAIQSRVERNAKFALEGAFGSPGSGANIDKDVAKKYDHFYGYMTGLITQIEKENGGKALDDQQIKQLTGRVLRETIAPPAKIFGFKVPFTGGGTDAIALEQKRQSYIDAFKERFGGAQPTDEQINEALMKQHFGE